MPTRNFTPGIIFPVTPKSTNPRIIPSNKISGRVLPQSDDGAGKVVIVLEITLSGAKWHKNNFQVDESVFATQGYFPIDTSGSGELQLDNLVATLIQAANTDPLQTSLTLKMKDGKIGGAGL